MVYLISRLIVCKCHLGTFNITFAKNILNVTPKMVVFKYDYFKRYGWLGSVSGLIRIAQLTVAVMSCPETMQKVYFYCQ